MDPVSVEKSAVAKVLAKLLDVHYISFDEIARCY